MTPKIKIKIEIEVRTYHMKQRTHTAHMTPKIKIEIKIEVRTNQMCHQEKYQRGEGSVE